MFFSSFASPRWTPSTGPRDTLQTHIFLSILQGRSFEVSEILRHGRKRCTPIRALYSNRLKKLYLTKKKPQKQYLAFVNEFSCTHPRAEHNTSGNLELASRPALQSQFSTVLAAVAGHCDTLNSPFPCHLADLAAPARHDTRSGCEQRFLPRSRRPPWLSFSLRTCSQELMCLDGRPAIQDVRVSHWRLRGRGPSS